MALKHIKKHCHDDEELQCHMSVIGMEMMIDNHKFLAPYTRNELYRLCLLLECVVGSSRSFTFN